MISVPLARFLLARHFRVQLLCALAPVLVGSILGTLYPILEEQRAPMRKILEALERMKLLPGNIEMLTSAAGTFGLPLLHPLTLVGFAVAGGIIPLAMPAGARTSGTLQVLLSTPLSRGKLVATTLVSTLPGVVVMAFAPVAGIFVASTVAGFDGALPWLSYVLLCLDAVLVIFCLAGIAMLIAVTSANRGQATVMYAVFIATFLLLELAGGMAPEVKWVTCFSPIGWYPVQDMLTDTDHRPFAEMGVLALAAVSLFGASVGIARRRRAA